MIGGVSASLTYNAVSDSLLRVACKHASALVCARSGEIVTADDATKATDPEHQRRHQKQSKDFY